MISINLQGVAELVVRQAQRHGFILPRQVRTVLSEAGLSEALWKDVLAVARSSLTYRKGRYYYTTPVSDRVRQEQAQQLGVHNAVREIIRYYRSSAQVERREEDRLNFVQPVKVKTEDGHEYTLLTRDLSSTGIRLIGTRRLLGQKIRVSIPGADAATNWEFVVRILWTCAVGGDLIENGGNFLEMVDPE
ncbi:MAG TPA: PilZ domain-containing protein [Gemmataceae bacterium]|nr:PilZ domain-containing protein [Gemmataceae bacterium]